MPFKIDQTSDDVANSSTTDFQIFNVLKATTDSAAFSPALTDAATIPSVLGGTAESNMVLIGLSALKDLHNNADANRKTHGKMFLGPYSDPTDLLSIIPMNVGKITASGYGTTSNGHGGLTQSSTYYLSDCYLSNVAVFNKALTDSEVSELWTSRGVW